jgi:methylmalonyl-CoA/ethylmalonyl-CoA epimerase
LGYARAQVDLEPRRRTGQGGKAVTPDEYWRSTLGNSFLDATLQICVVTHDVDAAVRRYAERFGIGPWWVQDAKAPAMTETKVRGVETPFSMRLALAWVGDLMWEIIQPLEGPTVYRDYLERNGNGVQHAAFSYGARSFEQARAEFIARGFEPVQELTWNGVRVCYLDTLDAAHTTFEIWHWPDDIPLGEPDYWVPAMEE